MSQLPGPLRAALGVVLTAVENARTFPEKAIELPVLAVSTALQFSLRAQQRYTEFALRGEELLTRFGGAEGPEEPPAWARFDDAPATGPTAGADRPTSGPAAPDTAMTEKTPTATKSATKPAAKQARTKQARTKQARTKPIATKPAAATTAPRKRVAKDVTPPRTGRPSAFDSVDPTS